MRDLDLRCEHEGDEMTHVHRVAAWTSAGVEVERLTFLVPVQDEIELAAQLISAVASTLRRRRLPM